MPSTYVVCVTATRGQVRQLIALLPAILSERQADPTREVRGLQMRMGMMLLALVKEAFIVKSRGGTDAAGLSWAPLKKETVAYHRRHPGLNAIRQAAKQKGRPGRPLLTDRQDKLWKRTYAQMVRAYKGDKQHAAAHAWLVTKAAGGKTILEEYGNRPVEILRDTDVLFNSLSPGVPGGGQAPPGTVMIGTNVSYARFHHYGTKHMPARPLWPQPEQWPQSWWDKINDALVSGAVKVLVGLLQSIR